MNNDQLTAYFDFLPGAPASVVSSPLNTTQTFTEITRRFAQRPGTVALVSGGDSDCARYNILGIDPWLTLRTTLTHATIGYDGRTVTIEADPFLVLQRLVMRYRLPAGEYPLPIAAGLLGYFSYDLKDCIEVLPRTSVDDLHLPHLYMVAPSVIVVEDRREKQTTVHISTVAGNAAELRAAFDLALAGPAPAVSSKSVSGGAGMRSCFTREEYMGAIDAIRDYIVRGHVYQVNMSQRFETRYSGDPYDLFVSLFTRNPAPFFAYINAGDHHIVSTSPERFIELRGNRVETRPIKGTRPRGRTPEEDRNLCDHLVNAGKDDAELSMIVDLLRNDIGKVCSAGSVKVREHKRIEAYTNVFHMVSIVDGLLDDDKDAVDLIRATFPGGSITGCPKIRSMEVIDELEPVRRHIYTGSIGYIGFNGDMDLSIAIRTATITNGRVLFSVGGGVVYDSDPADEYEETLHKGRTLMSAIGKEPDANRLFPVAWCNGRFRPLDEITVPVQHEGFLYGYGIFETIRAENGIPFRLPEHLERFNRSWRYCFATEPPDITWDAVVALVLDRCGLCEGVAAVKILAAAGLPGRPETMTLLVTARPYTHRLKSVARAGLYCAVDPFPRHASLSSHKTMNYLFCKMTNDRAKQQGADEGIILNVDGSVCETATANILCIIGGKWVRPASEYVLPGIMERAVCDLLAKRGTTVERRRLTVDELKKAERVFLTNALMGIVPVLRIDGTAIPGDAEDVCKEINSVLFSRSAAGSTL